MPREFTAEELMAPETYDAMLMIEDDAERHGYLLDLKDSARRVKFGVNAVNERIKMARQRYQAAQRGAGSKWTVFRDAPFPPLRCGQWDCTDLGVWRYDIDAFGAKTRITACAHAIAPTARLVNVDTGAEHLQLHYLKDGAWRQLVASRSELADKGLIVRRIADKGVEVTSENARELVRYISEVVSLNPDMLSGRKSIDHLGWVSRSAFAPYDDGIVFDGDDRFAPVFRAVREQGHFEVWRAAMRAQRQFNPLFRVVMAASFASPLLELLDALPFVLHLWGGTGAGKTVAAMCAMSIWGDPDKGKLMWSLDSTKVFFGQAAAFLRNIPFYGDEMQTVSEKYMSMDKLIMYLCEGVDRGRGAASGGIQSTKQWRNAFLFTGEQSISSDASGGGVKNRLIEVQLKDGDALVCDGNATVGIITQNFGHAGKKYIEAVRQKDVSDLRARYRELQKSLMERTDTTNKQAYSMAAMLLADEIACECIFPGDAPLTVDDVACYLQTRQEVDVAARAYDWTINWIARNPDRWKDTGYGERWGKLDDAVATINRDVLTEALNGAGYPYTAVIAAWGERGLIQRTTQGRNLHNVSYSGVKTYCIKLVLPSDTPQLPF